MYSREYWMIYRGPGFLAVGWFGSSPTPSPPMQSASCLSFSVFLYVAGEAYRMGGGEEGVGEKAWPSINHSIFSGVLPVRLKELSEWGICIRMCKHVCLSSFFPQEKSFPWHDCLLPPPPQPHPPPPPPLIETVLSLAGLSLNCLSNTGKS